MAKQKLFPAETPPIPDDTRKPHERFSDLAGGVLRVTKSEIDEREKAWKNAKHGGQSRVRTS
jgi:hypothetical protein